MVVRNLTAFTLYSIVITAVTGQLSNARTDGKASEPILVRTLEDSEDVCAYLIIRDPLNACMHELFVTFMVMFSQSPKTHVTLTVIPEEVAHIYVAFSPLDNKPNGNISAYTVLCCRLSQWTTLHLQPSCDQQP